MEQDPLRKSRRGHGGDIYTTPGQIRYDLSANINPHPLPPELTAALPAMLQSARAYPDIEYRSLRQLLADYVTRQAGTQIPPEWIIPGNGAVEILDKTIRTFTRGLILAPGFSEYELSCLRHGIPCRIFRRELTPTGILGGELAEVIRRELARDPAIDGLILCSPNNPDGARWDPPAFRELLDWCRDRGVTVLVDETFAEYLPPELMLLPLVADHENLVVVKALTKFFGLPGVRLGYGVTSSAARLTGITHGLTTWNVGAFAEGIAGILLRDDRFILATREENEREREALAKDLTASSWFDQAYPSSANFIMVHSPRMAEVITGLRERGILIRDLTNLQGLGPSFARIAVKAGSRAALVQALAEMSQES